MRPEKQKYFSFNFKEFSLTHQRSAMKVGTDGVLLGAWADVDNARVVWDVGSGSGLISLMIAQRCDADIYGVELDHNAFLDMRDNFSASKWASRLHAVEGDINDVCHNIPTPDMIVCNPPFFVDSLAANGEARSLARHEATLGCEGVIRLSAACLADGGRLALVAPTMRWADVEFASELHRMPLVKKIEIATSARKSASRMLCLFEKYGEYSSPVIEHRSLRTSEGEYDDWYKNLTRDFYLYLK